MVLTQAAVELLGDDVTQVQVPRDLVRVVLDINAHLAASASGHELRTHDPLPRPATSEAG